MKMDCPKPPIPEPLRGLEMGTFTHESVAIRMPDIGRRMVAENEFAPGVEAGLEALFAGIPDDVIRPLADDGAPDAADWARYVASYRGQNWLEVPWFFTETYFYRRILDITGFFQAGPGQGLDPFSYQKRQGLETTRRAIRDLSSQVNELLQSDGRPAEAFSSLLAVDLWGNQADLSLWPADGDEKPDHQDAGQQKAHTLVDETAAISHYLLGPENRRGRIDFVLDNAGFELVADLYLAAFLLEQNMAETIYLHAKAHPTFVSDAMIKDVQQTVVFLLNEGDPEAATAGQRLHDLLDNGRLRLQTHWFWTSPLDMWEMPAPLRRELGRSDLLISKGDANYRRLLGDRHWPLTTPFADVVCYLPAPVVALRTLKSEIAVGLTQGQPKKVAEQDPAWLYDGRWGVIQFAKPGR